MEYWVLNSQKMHVILILFFLKKSLH